MNIQNPYSEVEHKVFKRTFLQETEVGVEFDKPMTTEDFSTRIVPFVSKTFNVPIADKLDTSTEKAELTSSDGQVKFEFGLSFAKVSIGRLAYKSFSSSVIQHITILVNFIKEGTSEASSCNHVEPISSFEKTDITNSDNLISKLNINAGIKERLISRLIQFKNELKCGWNGNAELPMEEMSVSNALAAVDATSAEEFAKWTVFPSPNGTILFSPTDDHIAGISVGNDEFSYAAIGNRGQEIKGKEVFSVKSFKLAIRLINSMNEA